MKQLKEAKYEGGANDNIFKYLIKKKLHDLLWIHIATNSRINYLDKSQATIFK